MDLLIFLQTSPTAFYITIGITGLLVGSFLNVVIYRLPKMLENEWHSECCKLLDIDISNHVDSEEYNLIRPRSRCPRCGHKITALENIPILSFLVLGRKCSSCAEPISIRYPIVELLSAILAIVVAWHFGFGLQAILAIILTWALLTLSIIDIDCQLLPDDITLPLLWLGLLSNIFGTFTDIYSSLIGAMAGYILLWSVYKLFKIITGKEGMGYGDFKLLSLLGAWLGWQMLPLIIILSSSCGSIIGIGLILFRSHDKNNPIPFGPYLAMTGWIALIWGQELFNIYLRWAINA